MFNIVSICIPFRKVSNHGRSRFHESTAKAAKALLDFDLKKHRMSMNVNIVIDDPEELERVRQKEMDITKATGCARSSG